MQRRMGEAVARVARRVNEAVEAREDALGKAGAPRVRGGGRRASVSPRNKPRRQMGKGKGSRLPPQILLLQQRGLLGKRG